MKILLLLALLPLNLYSDVYEDLARATGGTFKRTTKEDFLNSIQDGKSRYDSLENAHNVFIQKINLQAGASKSFSFPVDDKTFGGLVVEVQGPVPGQFNLLGPDKINVSPAKENGPVELPVQINRSELNAVVVPKPLKGMWSLNLLGPVEGSLIVRVQSYLGFRTLRFVEVGGRPGHQGLFPMKTPPKKLSKALIEINEESLGENPEYFLLDESGNDLKGTFVSKGKDYKTVYLEMNIPGVPFRVLARGPGYQRFSELFNPL